MKGGNSSQDVKDIMKENGEEILKEDVKEQIAPLQGSMDEGKARLSILMKK